MSLKDDLVREHQTLEAYFDRFTASVETADRPQLMKEWTEFEKTVTEHFDDEERFLFPALEKDQPALVKDLQQAHQNIRAKIAELGMKADLRSLRVEEVTGLLADLTAHRKAEESAVYQWAEEHLETTSREKLLQRLAERMGRA